MSESPTHVPELRPAILGVMRALLPIMKQARANTCRLMLEPEPGEHPICLVIAVGPDAQRIHDEVEPFVKPIGKVSI
jgi:hypothetical protein